MNQTPPLYVGLVFLSNKRVAIPAGLWHRSTREVVYWILKHNRQAPRRTTRCMLFFAKGRIGTRRFACQSLRSGASGWKRSRRMRLDARLATLRRIGRRNNE